MDDSPGQPFLIDTDIEPKFIHILVTRVHRPARSRAADKGGRILQAVFVAAVDAVLQVQTGLDMRAAISDFRLVAIAPQTSVDELAGLLLI